MWTKQSGARRSPARTSRDLKSSPLPFELLTPLRLELTCIRMRWNAWVWDLHGIYSIRIQTCVYERECDVNVRCDR